MNESTQTAESVAVAALSERLRLILSKNGGSAAVAKRAGIPPTTLSNYVAGRDLKTAALVAIADACSVSIEWLASGRGDMSAGKISGYPGFDECLSERMNFHSFCILLVTCQEYFAKMRQSPSLGQVLEWISPLYPTALKLPDLKFRIVSDEETMG